MAKKDITPFNRTRRYVAGVTAINAATALTIADTLLAHGKKLDLPMVEYSSLRDPSGVLTAITGKSFKDRNAVALAFTSILGTRLEVEAAVDEVNAAINDTIQDIVETKGAKLGLDMEGYDALLDADKTTVCEALVGKEFKDELEIQTAFDAAIAGLGA